MRDKPIDVLDTESYWLQKAKANLGRRDPVDALNDAQVLLLFAHEQLGKVLGTDTRFERR